MSTRGAIGFRIGEKDKVMYNHSDSYPTWLGKHTLEFLQTSNMDELRTIASRIKLVHEQAKPTPAQKRACAAYTNTGVGNQSDDDWYCVLREAQGDLAAYRNGLEFMIDGWRFLKSSLFCEYGYVINCDTEMLEFYVGFQQNKGGRGRYFGKRGQKPYEGAKHAYYGCHLAFEIPLADIFGASKETLEAMVQRMDEYDRKKDDQQEALRGQVYEPLPTIQQPTLNK